MNKLTRDQVVKIRPFFRGLAGFFLFCTLIGSCGLIYVVFTEPLDFTFISAFGVVLIGGHISASILFTGYAPWYLLSAHGPKNDH